MASIIWVIFALELYLFTSSLARWLFVQQWLKRESSIVNELPGATKSDSCLIDDDVVASFFEQADVKESLMGHRWLDLKGIVESTGNIPVDQSFLDDELEAKIDDIAASLKSKAAIAVLLGLGGTLLGLSFGVMHLQNALPHSGQTLNLTDFADKMAQTISGFGSAFYSALAGVLTAILVGAIAAHLQTVSASFIIRFRSCCRTNLARLVNQSTNAVFLTQQLNALAKTISTLDGRLPTVEDVQESIEKMYAINDVLEDSARTVTEAYERSIKVLQRPNSISDALVRLEILLTEHTQRTESVIKQTMGAIEQAARKQGELSEELTRLVLDAPLEVASARLVVSDRREFQKMQQLLENRIDRVDFAVKQSKVIIEKIADRESVLKRFWKWVRK